MTRSRDLLPHKPYPCKAHTYTKTNEEALKAILMLNPVVYHYDLELSLKKKYPLSIRSVYQNLSLP